ncbi:hypothetical protein [Ahrensia kielensis]|uniref:hypothetical protein n=1 Tax=Ahrensia kielensis TaxID=76980 RepID=UPI000377B9D8|nr:hypothetical protein [Ahrensia kielensis]
MYRFFSIAVMLNWLAVLCVLGIVGFGLENGSGGMIAALNETLSGEAGLQLPAVTAKLLTNAAVLTVMIAAVWALLAIIFAAPNGVENNQLDLVIMLSMGICLCVFAVILALAIYTSAAVLSAMVCIASFATILAGIAHRVFMIEAEGRKMPVPANEGFGLAGARNMQRPNANLAMSTNMTANRNNRFVPKRNFQPMN